MQLETWQSVGLFVILLAIVGLIVFLFRYIWRLTKKGKGGPDHIELYFDEHFRNIIDEWDLMPRAKIKTWKRDMNKKLKVINRDIENVKKKRVGLNTRLDVIEREMKNLEEF